MDPIRVFPDWLAEAAPEDSVLAEAYDSMPDARRALLKKAIARLYAFYGPRKVRSEYLSREFDSGLFAVTAERPKDFAVLLTDEAAVSPARFLAALVPALILGPAEVACVRIESAWPPALLAAMELAGAEVSAELPAEAADALLEGLAASGRSGVVLGLGGEFTARAMRGAAELDGAPALWRPGLPQSPRLGVFREEGEFDLEALAFAHPDLVVEAWGKGGAPRSGFKRRKGGLEAFLGAGYDASYVPERLLEAAAAYSPLSFGPGCEALWAWPDLSPQLFLERRLAFTEDE